MNAITPVLIDYWRRLPAISPDSRLQALEETRRHVSAREVPAGVLIPFALGDSDEDVVFAAATAFVGVDDAGAAPRESAIEDAVEWIRRNLALNRGAVFAALLSAGDPSINERLAPYRLSLATDEIATVCRKAPIGACETTLDFLRTWVELLGDDAELPEVAMISAALGAQSSRGAASSVDRRRIVPSHAVTSRGLRSPSQPNTIMCHDTR
jgi:hypothetical protein